MWTWPELVVGHILNTIHAPSLPHYLMAFFMHQFLVADFEIAVAYSFAVCCSVKHLQITVV